MKASSISKVNISHLERIKNDSELEKVSSLQSTSTLLGNKEGLLRPLFLPLEKPRVPAKYRFNIFLLLTTFLNILYYLLLVPFRIAKKSERYSTGNVSVLQTNVIQMILSSSFVLVVTIYSLLSSRQVLAWYSNGSQKELLDLYDSISICFIPVIWVATFWLKRKSFEKLLLICQGECQSLLEKPVRISQPKSYTKYVVNTIIIVHILILTYGTVWDNESWEFILTQPAGEVMFAFYIRPEYLPVPLEDLYNSSYMFWGSVISFIINNGFLLIINFFQIFCVIGAFMVHEACSNFTNKIQKLADDEAYSGMNSQDLSQSLQELSTGYLDLVTVIETINEIFGMSIGVYFLRGCPAVVSCSFVPSTMTILEIILTFATRIFLFFLVNIIASNGASKVQRYKQWLFEMSVREYFSGKESANYCSIPNANARESDAFSMRNANGLQSFLNILHRQVNCEDVALKGYKFFSVTYSLFGTILGFVVTFALFLVQFKDEDNSTSSNLSTCTCSEGNNATFGD